MIVQYPLCARSFIESKSEDTRTGSKAVFVLVSRSFGIGEGHNASDEGDWKGGICFTQTHIRRIKKGYIRTCLHTKRNAKQIRLHKCASGKAGEAGGEK